MIPFIRSINELMVITQSRDQRTNRSGNLNFNSITEDSGQRKRYLRSRIEQKLDLPNIPKTTRKRWIKSRQVVSKIINNLDYNNQMKPKFDLTLIEVQNSKENHDAA